MAGCFRQINDQCLNGEHIPGMQAIDCTTGVPTGAPIYFFPKTGAQLTSGQVAQLQSCVTTGGTPGPSGGEDIENTPLSLTHDGIPIVGRNGVQSSVWSPPINPGYILVGGVFFYSGAASLSGPISIRMFNAASNNTVCTATIAAGPGGTGGVRGWFVDVVDPVLSYLNAYLFEFTAVPAGLTQAQSFSATLNIREA